jgi:lysophospholipid acyltransferase (LPLAT)-like uncharacterized protein
MDPEPAPPAAPARKKRRSGVVVPHAPRWYHRLVGWLVALVGRTVVFTLRKRQTDASGIATSYPKPVIFCVWHNRLGLAMHMYFGFARKQPTTQGLAALVSASKDGAFLASILEAFGVEPVRGSSSRRGPQALLELTTWAERGYDLAITPDGPRGPRYVVQEGVMSLAQLTGLPIVPAGCHFGWKFQVRSWDRFQIPVPFSRCQLYLGQPIVVPRDCSDAEREALRKRLEAALKEIAKD